MKKNQLVYETPSVEILEIEAEQVFAGSTFSTENLDEEYGVL